MDNNYGRRLEADRTNSSFNDREIPQKSEMKS